MIGTPDLSKVCIWRENSCTSIDVTFFSFSRRQISWMLEPASPLAVAVPRRVGRISTGVTPVPNSWSATAPLSGPSSTPCISSPRALRPL